MTALELLYITHSYVSQHLAHLHVSSHPSFCRPFLATGCIQCAWRCLLCNTTDAARSKLNRLLTTQSVAHDLRDTSMDMADALHFQA